MSIELCSLFTQIDTKTLSRYFGENFKKVKKQGLKIDNKYFKNEIKKFIFLHSTEKQRAVVKEIALDMANTMQNIAKGLFPTCLQVIDRFHVMKNVLEDMGALISKNKTEIKKAYLEEQEQAKKERRQPKHQRYANTETKLELISRGRYQLLKRRKDWNLNQQLRCDCMELIPGFEEIVAMYKQIEKIFEIYDSKITVKQAKKEFDKWFTSVSKLDFITELQNAGRMVKNHIDRIVNYFNSRLTNGYAEGLNSRMQKIIYNSKGFKDQDYMIYRMIKIFG